MHTMMIELVDEVSECKSRLNASLNKTAAAESIAWRRLQEKTDAR